MLGRLVTVLRSSPIRHMLTLRKGKDREKEKNEEKAYKDGERRRAEAWNQRPILEVSPGESLDGAVPRRLDKGLICPKFIREFGPHPIPLPTLPKNSLARMTPAHFLFFSVSPPHLHRSTRSLTSIQPFVLRPP